MHLSYCNFMSLPYFSLSELDFHYPGVTKEVPSQWLLLLDNLHDVTVQKRNLHLISPLTQYSNNTEHNNNTVH